MKKIHLMRAHLPIAPLKLDFVQGTRGATRTHSSDQRVDPGGQRLFQTRRRITPAGIMDVSH